MNEVEKAIASLEKYVNTPWGDSGPGDSTLASNIRVVLKELKRFQSEVEEVEKEIQRLEETSRGPRNEWN